MGTHLLVTSGQVGQLLRSTRKARRLSQAALASQLGLGQSRVSELESNAGWLSVDQLLAWCAALGLELSVSPKGHDAKAVDTADW